MQFWVILEQTRSVVALWYTGTGRYQEKHVADIAENFLIMLSTPLNQMFPCTIHTKVMSQESHIILTTQSHMNAKYEEGRIIPTPFHHKPCQGIIFVNHNLMVPELRRQSWLDPAIAMHWLHPCLPLPLSLQKLDWLFGSGLVWLVTRCPIFHKS